MLPLMFAALIDTVIAPPPDFDTVYVHEWGAVTFTEEEVFFGAAPPGGLLESTDFDDWDEPVARAPVVYFYGAPFTGAFTVTVPNGVFIETVPEPVSPEGGLPVTPSSAVPDEAVWRFSSDPWDDPSQLPDRNGGCIPTALLETWRWPDSNILRFDDGAREKFIYYECTLNREACEQYLQEVLPGPDRIIKQPMIRFRSEMGMITAQVFDSDGVECEVIHPVTDGDLVLETLCDWAGGAMKSEEIAAMWDTWEDWVMSGSWSGEALVIFPISGEFIESVTTISLRADEDLEIEYTRFYIGIVSV